MVKVNLKEDVSKHIILMKATFISREKNDVKFTMEFTAEEFEKQKVDASQFTLDAKLKAGVSLTEVNVNLPGSNIESGLINSSFAQSEKEEENEEIINE